MVLTPSDQANTGEAPDSKTERASKRAARGLCPSAAQRKRSGTKLNRHGSRGLLVFALEHKQELEGLRLFPSDFR